MNNKTYIVIHRYISCDSQFATISILLYNFYCCRRCRSWVAFLSEYSLPLARFLWQNIRKETPYKSTYIDTLGNQQTIYSYLFIYFFKKKGRKEKKDEIPMTNFISLTKNINSDQFQTN